MNTRLLGAAVLIALAVLFVPMFFSSKPPAGGDQNVSLAIPPAPDRELQTRTMSLNPQGPSSTGSSAHVMSSDRLATVNIGSNRPRDVETDPEAGKAREKTRVTMGSGASPAHPVIPMQNGKQSTSPGTGAGAKADVPVETPKALEAATPAAAAGDGAYSVNLGAYANAGNVESLRRKVKALGYASSAHAVSISGKRLTQVAAGPFATRTAAEAARLKIAQGVPGVHPSLDHDAQTDGAKAKATPAKHGTGGWAVQLAALGSEADAKALRDKLRSNGFDGYVNAVKSGGRQLWQVRAGPLTQRAEAQRVQGQIKAKLGINGAIRRVP